jgi:hypothetical protein
MRLSAILLCKEVAGKGCAKEGGCEQGKLINKQQNTSKYWTALSRLKYSHLNNEVCFDYLFLVVLGTQTMQKLIDRKDRQKCFVDHQKGMQNVTKIVCNVQSFGHQKSKAHLALVALIKTQNPREEGSPSSSYLFHIPPIWTGYGCY